MKKIAVISFIILTLCLAAFAQKKTVAKSDPAKEVKAAFDRLVEGIKEANVEKVMGVYENSDRTFFLITTARRRSAGRICRTTAKHRMPTGRMSIWK